MDELSLACQKVGRFLHQFALVEQEINERIVDMLGLKGAAAQVVAHDLDFFKKVNILRIIAIETAPAADKRFIKGLFKAITRADSGHVRA
jgi:hypothetical protein